METLNDIVSMDKEKLSQPIDTVEVIFLWNLSSFLKIRIKDWLLDVLI